MKSSTRARIQGLTGGGVPGLVGSREPRHSSPAWSDAYARRRTEQACNTHGADQQVISMGSPPRSGIVLNRARVHVTKSGLPWLPIISPRWCDTTTNDIIPRHQEQVGAEYAFGPVRVEGREIPLGIYEQTLEKKKSTSGIRGRASPSLESEPPSERRRSGNVSPVGTYRTTRARCPLSPKGKSHGRWLSTGHCERRRRHLPGNKMST